MTAKSAVRKPRKAPSAAELKRQLATERKKADAANGDLSDIKAMLKLSMDNQANLERRVEELARAPTAKQILEQHDKAERVINNVLGEAVDSDGYPSPPEQQLPSYLQAIKRQVERHARNYPAMRTGDRDQVDTTNHAIGQCA